MTGGMEKSKIMSQMASSSSPAHVMSHPANLKHSEKDVTSFYDLNHTAPQVPMQHPAASSWADQFHPAQSQVPVMPPQMGYQPHFRPPPMMQHFAPMYGNPIYTPQAHMQPPTVSLEPQSTTAQVSVNDDLAAAKRMVEMLRNSGNPKYANSTFVDFIDQVANQQLSFQGGDVVDKDGKVVDWDSIYDDNQSTTEGIGDLLEGIGDDSENLPDQMERIWNELRHDNQFLRDRVEGTNNSTYDFKYSDNSYIESRENLVELAIKLMGEGQDMEALKVLEAEVRVNENSSEGWKLLGQLHAQFDCDSEAIKCLEKGYACDAYNLDSIMALGVSLTNELDSIRAMEILKQWISNHDMYHDLVMGPPVASAAEDDPTPDYDFVRLKKQVMSLFQRAAERNPQDFDIAIALGVLHNINRDYALAIESFIRAIEIRPNDFSAWNKLGATLANSGLSREALQAYHQALAIKPNYARAWCNLAIAHSNLNEYEFASKFFITALQLSPNANHIWSSLFIALSNWIPEKGEIGEMVERKDLGGIVKSIPGLPNVNQLPQPGTPSLGLNVIRELKRTLLID